MQELVYAKRNAQTWRNSPEFGHLSGLEIWRENNFGGGEDRSTNAETERNMDRNRFHESA